MREGQANPKENTGTVAEVADYMTDSVFVEYDSGEACWTHKPSLARVED